MACQIFRDAQNNIQSVQTPQGEPSVLYREALAITQDQEKALEIAMVPYTQGYQSVNGQYQTEPALEDVLIFMNRRNNQDKKLSKQDIDGLMNNTTAIEQSTVEEIYVALEPLYPNGVFTVSKATLRATNLYTEAEIETILVDTTSQNAIRNIADKIRAQASLNSEEDINERLAMYETPELISVSDTSELTGIQKFRQLNPFLIDTQIRQVVGGIQNREEFENSLGTLPEAITDEYFGNPEYANKFFNTYSSMTRMPMLEDSEEGVSSVYQNNIQKFTQQALVVGQPSTELLQTVDLLLSTPKSVWLNSGIEIEDLLLRAEDFAADLGIDIVGISNQEFTYEEGQDFLASLENLAGKASIGTVNNADIQNFADNYNAVFKENLSPLITAQNVKPANAKKSLVFLDTIKSEQQLFDENSFVKAEDKIYQRVNKQQDLEGLYDYLTDLVQFNPNIIEKKALFPTAYNAKNVFSLSAAKNEKNKAELKEDIRRYVQQQPFSEDLTIYKIAFGHPIEFPIEKKNVAQFSKNSRSYDYLTGDFIADFAREYLQEKQNESQLFQKLYNHFKFNESGIALKDNDPYSRQEIELWTPEKHPLRQYVAISKNSELNTLYPSSAQQISEREFYMNNPEQLPQKTVQYELSEDNEYLATENLQDNFINMNGVVWEKARTYKNMTIYQRLPVLSNPYYNEYDVKVNINTSVDPTQFEGLISTLENISEIEKMYTSKEKITIDKERDCR